LQANAQTLPPHDGRARAVIESITPQVDNGRFPAKRVIGDLVEVQADCFADGHDAIAVVLNWRRAGEPEWKQVAMAPLGNDRWTGCFVVDALGLYEYRVIAWVDHFLSWRRDLARREDAEDIRVAALVGAQLAEEAAQRADAGDRDLLRDWAARLRQSGAPQALKALSLDETFAALAMRHPDRRYACSSDPLQLRVDPVHARFGSWYELFPRSAADEPGRHGTLRDVEARLPYVAAMGFDILYLPPVHPIGRINRKGRNNALVPEPDDVGSPWAIGADEGGHKSIHPDLGTLEDFRSVVASARKQKIRIALDIAFQCAPDHPYVKAHPEWFKHRPDGSVQYAENPPKKYQDIYPFDFESDDWQGLWTELLSIFRFWIDQGVTVFRVDNPHTKAFPFWEWCIGEIKRTHPETVFLSEAFTRPRVMHRLAKLGFTQSYTYFTWRNTKQELIDYFNELAHGPGADYFRPNVWPNTPDILPEHLQYGGRPAFMARLVLAATLASAYGIYGPAFEHMEHRPREPGSEEYLDSEKYQLRHWDLGRDDSLAEFIARVNAIRHENVALQDNRSLRFLEIDNINLLAYAKSGVNGDSLIVTVVNLDYHHTQSGWIELDLQAFGMDPDASYQMHELLTGARYLWHGARNYVSLDPQRSPAQIFRVRRRVRREQDFDYFL